MGNADFSSDRARRLLYVIVFTLVFEGFFRKLSPPAIGTLIFFIKDILCLIAFLLVLKVHGKWIPKTLLHIYALTLILFIPVVVSTAYRDPILGIFGAKQYLLYAVVAGLASIAFHSNDRRPLYNFMTVVGILLIPTAIVAIIQDRLPYTHWLNRTVWGETNEAFSAGGKLRLSSTFSFCGQYSYFLNFVTSFLGALILLKNKTVWIGRLASWPLLGGLLLISVFITGGRTAVVGSALILIVSSVLMSIRAPIYFLPKLVLLLVMGGSIYLAIRLLLPEYFIAYEARTSGESGVSHSEELLNRITESLIVKHDSEFWGKDPVTLIFGRGIGVMTNGSEKISSYAKQIRESGSWTETDLATTVWEGGIYLVAVWYSIRIFLILMCMIAWLKIKQRARATIVAPMVAFVLIFGVTGTLSLQSPLAIWWWLSIGLICALSKDTQPVQVTAARTICS